MLIVGWARDQAAIELSEIPVEARIWINLKLLTLFCLMLKALNQGRQSIFNEKGQMQILLFISSHFCLESESSFVRILSQFGFIFSSSW